MASFVLAACDRSSIEPSQSLVGAKELPTANSLSREIIIINRGHWGLVGANTPGTLAYQINPDDSLSIERTRTDPKTWKQTTVGKQVFHVSSASAQAVRRMLWRLRPAKLQGIQDETLPTGCRPLPTDSGPQMVVNFIDSRLEPGETDHGIAITLVPFADQCESMQANQARALVQKILRSFPKSKVAADYDVDDSRWKERMTS